MIDRIKIFLFNVISFVLRKRELNSNSKSIKKYTLMSLVLIFLLVTAVLFSQIIILEKKRQKSVDINILKDYEKLRNELKNNNWQLENEINELEEESRVLLNTLLKPNDKQGRWEIFEELLAEKVFSNEEIYKSALQLAALTKIESVGLRIILDDSEDIKYGPEEREQIIHDADIRFFVDSLKVFYPLGISINGERLTMTSKIICNGPTVQVNQHFKAAPFIIEVAFLNSEECNTALSYLLANNKYQEMKKRGLNISIEKVDSIKLAPFNNEEIIHSNFEFLTHQDFEK